MQITARQERGGMLIPKDRQANSCWAPMVPPSSTTDKILDFDSASGVYIYTSLMAQWRPWQRSPGISLKLSKLGNSHRLFGLRLNTQGSIFVFLLSGLILTSNPTTDGGYSCVY
ncbi:solute carrier organic anion transporter family member 1B3 [Platysternon megacephalum]|uniref:Solute carrier organic anion transporter family member 1B3 n=1 Tax=Platysternon megacephalum TaxID=55544 RepID=A0A4D9EL08_9SAUR|nr:solute carrier organic anion transporter family member 1B3 [Platysternon megacephalum]